ncbi:protein NONRESPONDING TO OXYLIPINS 2, mitochondrial isoform X1 [Manihot esculenta]|uniref:protein NONRESPONDING TO OXYLIPINS 2, mitochondrial isoform X1 n=1 Tax=Manihot esculenta TaxID=3983 RepID=UPI000B5D5789|nr:protein NONRESPONDING TO OXYLIPINS 2, mitochondrial isoform X1 [Manihot esculenta]
MASRYRSLSRSSISLLKSAVNKPTLKPNPIPSSQLLSRSFLTSPRSVPQLSALQSLLPLHSAVSSARLTSCLGIDSRSSRSLSQGGLSDFIPKTYVAILFFRPF